MKDNIQLAAINPVLESNIVKPTESKRQGSDMISWGDNNRYPIYLWDLYQNVATLQSAINSTVDYINGNEISCTISGFEQVNKKGETISDIVRKISLDKMIFGGFALQIIRNKLGQVSEIYALDFLRVRSNKDNTIFYYAEDWSQYRVKSIKYPAFSKGDTNPSSIYYNKGNITRGVYPIPVYGAAVLACETEKAINEFHLNNVNNNFSGSCIINFNNGQPTDEVKDEIERSINEKFSGYQNAGRTIISFNDSKDSATTIERLDSDDFDAKYQSLSEHTKDQIFTAFRINKNLLGLNADNIGFSSQEFNDAFRLFNKTVVKPIQKEIVGCFDKIFGQKDSVVITPFSL